MAMNATIAGGTTAGDTMPGDTMGGNTGAPADLRWFIFALFFIFGGITSLNDVLIPKLKELFSLSYFEVMLTQSAFFAAYFIISMPGAGLVARFGYMRTAAIGLVTMTLGCLLFIPASMSAAFVFFLGALFVLASGITIVQVVANPLISLLGPAATASSRLTFAQAFNSLGTTVAPYLGAALILGAIAKVDASKLSGAALDAYRATETQIIVKTYLGIAAALLVVAALVWLRRDRLTRQAVAPVRLANALHLLAHPRFAMGALCLFLYVGAEVAIGSLMVSYLIQPTTLAIAPQSAAQHVAFYWGGAMVGRFIGAAVMRVVSPGKVLAGVALAAFLLLVLSGSSAGAIAGWSLIAIGLCNAIMFPTIFALASEGLGARAAEGSGLLCMAIVGGAIVPLLTGYVADRTSLATALIVPAICYVTIAIYGLRARAMRAG